MEPKPEDTVLQVTGAPIQTVVNSTPNPVLVEGGTGLLFVEEGYHGAGEGSNTPLQQS